MSLPYWKAIPFALKGCCDWQQSRWRVATENIAVENAVTVTSPCWAEDVSVTCKVVNGFWGFSANDLLHQKNETLKHGKDDN